MRKTILLLGCALFLSIVCVSGLFAQESLLDEIQKRGVVKVGMFLQWPPMEFRDPVTREPKGLEVDIANLLAADLGAKLEIIDMEWEAIIPGLLAKKYDVIIAGMTRTPKRNLAIELTSKNLEVSSVMALVRINETRSTYEDFNKKGTVITCLMGSTTAVSTIGKFFPLATMKPMQSNPAVLEVESGRADLCVISNIFAYNYVRTNPGKVKVIFEKTPLSYEPSAIGLRKGDCIFLHWLDNWIQYQWDRGILQSLMDKWVVRGGKD
jgi:polar amino acid transport system substrate-binding protein